MYQIGNTFPQYNYQQQLPPPPPPEAGRGHNCQGTYGAQQSQQIQSPAYWSQMMSAQNNLFSGWNSFSDLGFSNPGFNTSYTNPGFNTSYTHPGFGLSSGVYGNGSAFGSAGFDYSSFAASLNQGSSLFGTAGYDYTSLASSLFQGNSLLTQSLGYGSGLLGGLGLSSLGYSNPGFSNISFPYDLLMQGDPAIPMF